MATTYTNLLFHIVFSTKQRAPYITDRHRSDLYDYIGGIVRGEGGVLLDIGGMPDHVHLLTRFKADAPVATMVRKIKSSSSKWMNEQALDFRFGWQTGYGAFTVSESRVGAIQRYIRNQAAHHRKRSFKEEFLGLLKRHNVDFDERYVFE